MMTVPRTMAGSAAPRRASWLDAPAMYALNVACRAVVDAFGVHVYLVGSALLRADFRDVDVRCILPDEEFDRLFPGPRAAHVAWLDARNAVLSAAVSEWLAARTGLRIDFQFQRRTEANASYGGQRRKALGYCLALWEDDDFRGAVPGLSARDVSTLLREPAVETEPPDSFGRCPCGRRIKAGSIAPICDACIRADRWPARPRSQARKKGGR